jgi:periplasmic divalent cation tolerance protein
MPSTETSVCAVLTTAPDRATAEALARALVDERLAACVNVVPGVCSVYRWQGEVQQDDELLLVIKTGVARAQEVAARIKDLHPYDLPEVLALPSVGGSPAYLQWVETETTP